MIIQAESLKRLVDAIIKQGGSSDEEAQVVADHRTLKFGRTRQSRSRHAAYLFTHAPD